MTEEKEPGDVAESKAQTKTTSGDTTGVYPNATGITEIAMGVTEDICTFKVPLNYVLLGSYYDENNEEQSIQGLDSTMTTMEEAMSEGGFSTGKHLACFSMASLEADGTGINVDTYVPDEITWDEFKSYYPEAKSIGNPSVPALLYHVDRLAMICEDGTMYGEEYTLVTVADYVLKHTPGNTVSNLSSTRALRDVTRKYGMQYNAAAVGEVNVVTKMKETNAVIGGEGNGGVIYPESHYGRDALVGIALFLSHLAHEGKKVSELRASYPNYYIAKNRIDLTPQTDVDAILAKVKDLYKAEEINDIDGVKIDFPDKWVHLRKSNTEPIIRVYSEAATMEAADELGKQIMDIVYSLAK